MTHPAPARPSQSFFARDVLVNVVANLVTAGIIYLLAAAAGYIKAKPVVSGFVLAFLVAVALPIAVHGLTTWLTARRTE